MGWVLVKGAAHACRIHATRKGPQLPKTVDQEHAVYNVLRRRTVFQVFPEAPALSLNSELLVKSLEERESEPSCFPRNPSQGIEHAL